MRPAAHSLSFASPKESKQRKGDPAVRVPSLRCGQPAVLGLGACRRTHCALRASFKQLRQVSSQSMRAATRMPAPRPALLGTARREGGDETGHRYARPGAARREAPAPIGAERSDGPCRAAPLWLRLGRGACGVGMGALAPMLRELIRRGCLNEARQRAVSSTAHPKREHRRLPAAKRRDTASGVAFLLPTFLWRDKEK